MEICKQNVNILLIDSSAQEEEVFRTHWAKEIVKNGSCLCERPHVISQIQKETKKLRRNQWLQLQGLYYVCLCHKVICLPNQKGLKLGCITQVPTACLQAFVQKKSCGVQALSSLPHPSPTAAGFYPPCYSELQKGPYQSKTDFWILKLGIW